MSDVESMTPATPSVVDPYSKVFAHHTFDLLGGVIKDIRRIADALEQLAAISVPP
jgi:hypothetical protein